jgi:hypothetical protein
VNSRWNRAGGGALGAALVCWLLIAACASSEERRAARKPPTDPAQIDAELLGNAVAEIVDEVMSYKSAHQGRLPVSFRQAGMDTLTSLFARRLGREGNAPLITIVFRRREGHVLSSCQGTNAILEDKLLRAGAFDVKCTLLSGETKQFTVPGPPPPELPKS